MFLNQDIKILAELLEEGINPDGSWAIYGTGDGASLIYMILNKLSLSGSIKMIIEKDENVRPDQIFQGTPVRKLTEACGQLDGIIIGAIDNHEIIYQRILKNLTKEQLGRIRLVNIFKDIRERDWLRYLEHIERSILKKSDNFIGFDKERHHFSEKDTKVIAWYLPQFHQLEINNQYHGQGFTEWTNTSKMIPLFTGHYQPHIPFDVGYYDLLNPETLRRQVYLAKHYGIYGFCIHYYWFSGKRFMEKPLELFLKHKELDMPFCLDWATENWTALWDGENREIMIEQKLGDHDDEKFMEDILPYMKDSRYIKIDGRPVLVIYRVNIFEKERARLLFHNFREIARENGFPDLYIMLTTARGFQDNVKDWGADALVEYHPSNMTFDMAGRYKPLGYVNPYFNGETFDMEAAIEERRYLLPHEEQTYYRSVLTSWDNTARKALSKGIIFRGLNPGTFKKWLADIVAESKEVHSGSEDFVFVNSWNEWAEGSHLEPDLKYGYAYLQAVKEVLEEQRDPGK